MKNIDFLPARYREQSASRHAQWWRLVVVALFGGLVATTTLYQWWLGRGVNAELAVMNLQYASAQEQEQLLTQTLAEAALSASEAELQAYLKHPWPRTQVLTALAAAIPDTVAIKEVRLGQPGGAEGARPAPAPAAAANSEQAQVDLTKLPAAERDLKRLREERDERRVVVEVEGATGDLAALHLYVAQLAASPLFDRADLVSIENRSAKEKHEGAEERSAFKLRLLLKFGIGQTHGPANTAAGVSAPTSPAKG